MKKLWVDLNVQICHPHHRHPTFDTSHAGLFCVAEADLEFMNLYFCFSAGITDVYYHTWKSNFILKEIC